MYGRVRWHPQGGSSPVTDDERKYFELIEGVITRLAGNSFSIKGWAVALIAVLGGLAAKDADLRFSSALLFPAFCFWGLDAFYLRQEKLFRKLYQNAIEGRTRVFSMDPGTFDKDVESFWHVAFSPTVRWLHLPILIFVVILMVYASLHKA
jgi:hypothetical protein